MNKSNQLFRLFMLLVIFLCVTNNIKAESFTITKTGNEYLSSFFPENSCYFITDLKIIGEVNVYDIQFLRNISRGDGNLSNLDLSEVTFVDINGIISFFQEHDYKAGQQVYGENIVKKIHNFPYLWRKYNSNASSNYGVWKGRYYKSFIGYDIEYTYIDYTRLIFERTPIYIGLDAIPSHMFDGCEKLKSIILPPHVTIIGDYAFNGCVNLENIIIPSNVTRIGDYAFADCEKLQDIIFPQSLSAIGGYSFKCCSGLASITIPDSVNSLGTYAFTQCNSLKSAQLPDNLKIISVGLFKNCTSLKSVNIPKQCTDIGTYAFDCTDLDSVILYENVKKIGSNAFLSGSLTTVYSMSTMPPTCETYPFTQPEYRTLYVPKGCVERYSLCPVWKDFGTILEMPESMGIETISDNRLLKKRVFTLDGKEHSVLQPGINIIKYENGQTEKIYVKEVIK